MKHLLILIVAAFFVSLSSGCSSLFGPSKPEPGASTERRSPGESIILEKKASGVEVTWEVPSDPVDGFIIRYGHDRAQLSKEAKILISELRAERDPTHGPVYRYIIHNIAPEDPIFVSVAAFKGDTISDFSEAATESRS